MSGYTLKTIARIRSDFPTKFGIPRQAGIVSELESLIVFEPDYRNDEALRGIEDFSHLWLIWQFSENVREDWSPTVRPPRLGGNTRLGVAEAELKKRFLMVVLMLGFAASCVRSKTANRRPRL